jgi:hypothetical protein
MIRHGTSVRCEETKMWCRHAGDAGIGSNPVSAMQQNGASHAADRCKPCSKAHRLGQQKWVEADMGR